VSAHGTIRRKLWRWRYRFDGKEKMMALGEYPLVTLKDARERHFAARKMLAAGIDPMAERNAEAEDKQREAQECHIIQVARDAIGTGFCSLLGMGQFFRGGLRG
jgi:hypothetical protein